MPSNYTVALPQRHTDYRLSSHTLYTGFNVRQRNGGKQQLNCGALPYTQGSTYAIVNSHILQTQRAAVD